MNTRIFVKQFQMSLKLYLRTPAAIFWMIAFPIVMLIGFGVMFGGNSDSAVKLVWARSRLPRRPTPFCRRRSASAG